MKLLYNDISIPTSKFVRIDFDHLALFGFSKPFILHQIFCDNVYY